MTVSKWFNVRCLSIALLLGAAACGGSDGDTATPASVDGAADAGATTTEAAEPADDDASSKTTSEQPASDAGGSGSSGNGVILADLCSGEQFVNGAITIDDLVSYGLFTSTDVRVESNSAYEASTYETFGFICNIFETVGDGENGLTIGVSSGSDTWDLAVEQGTAPAETIGEWDVIVGSNWLSPLTMRTTDEAGNQDSIFVLWTPSDGSIPDAETLERVMRPLAEAMGNRVTADIPRG